MNVLMTILQAVQILAAIGMIGLILMQHGKGADAGAAFGGGGSGSASLFGASGSANFLSRTTSVLAGVFLATTLGLAYFGHSVPTAAKPGSVLEQAIPASTATPAAGSPVPATSSEAPAVPAGGAAQIPGK
jgi:preprotein translocase subunit SecG